MKKRLVVLGAVALTAAAAVPAFALDNEFHGMYRLRANMTNFQAVGGLGVGTGSNVERDYTLFEQRARLNYIAKASDDLKLVTHFEIDSTWGDAAYNNGRGAGAGLAGDSVNLETKNVYLDFNLPSSKVNMKVGLQGFSDAYKGVFLSDDVAGAVAKGSFGPVTTTAAFLRTYDGNGANSLGKKNVDVYVLDAKLSPSKALTVGGSYYLANNDVNYSGQQLHVVGLNAAAKAGILDLDAFLLYQAGDELYSAAGKEVSAFAAQVAAKANLGMLTARGAFLYATGDEGTDATKTKAYQNIFASGPLPTQPIPTTTTAASAAVASQATAGSSTSSGVYYSSNMLMLLRSVYALDSDVSLVSSINNGNKGLMAGFLGADAKLSDKLSASANAGFAWVDKKAATDNDKYIGTEINLAVNYALYANLSATAQGGYVLLGDYYKGKANAAGTADPEDPYLAGLMLNYSF